MYKRERDTDSLWVSIRVGVLRRKPRARQRCLTSRAFTFSAEILAVTEHSSKREDKENPVGFRVDASFGLFTLLSTMYIHYVSCFCTGSEE